PDQVVFTFDARDDPAVLPLRQPLSSARWRVGGTEYRQFLAVPGAGHLFLLALDQPPGQAWVAGRNYHKLALAPDGADTASSEAALSAPALAPGNDGAIRHAYVGDAGGRLWRLDFDDGWQQHPPPPTP